MDLNNLFIGIISGIIASFLFQAISKIKEDRRHKSIQSSSINRNQILEFYHDYVINALTNKDKYLTEIFIDMISKYTNEAREYANDVLPNSFFGNYIKLQINSKISNLYVCIGLDCMGYHKTYSREEAYNISDLHHIKINDKYFEIGCLIDKRTYRSIKIEIIYQIISQKIYEVKEKLLGETKCNQN